MSLSAKSDAQIRNEVYVLRAAKELAKKHISDVLQVVIEALNSHQYSICAGHDGHISTVCAEGKGREIANGIMRHLLDDAPIDYRKMICEANEDDDVIDEDTVQDDLKSYVSDLMQKWE